MHNLTLRNWIAVLLPVLILPVLSLGQQVAPGEIRGRVWDEQGRPLAQASLLLQERNTGKLYEIQAGADGRFLRRRLPLGRYDLSVKGPGENNWNIPLRLTPAQPVLRVELDMGKLQEAARAYRRFTQQLQQQSAEAREQQEREAFRQRQHNRGVRLLRVGQPEEALAVFDELLAGDPGQEGLLALRASALAAAGRTGEAVPIYENLLARDSREASYHNNLGILLARAGRLEEAIAHFKSAVKSDKRRAATYEYNLGSALLNAGRYREASKQLRSALKRDPTMAEAHYFYGLSVLHQDAGGRERKRAASSLRRYLQLEPDGAYADQARAHLEQLSRGGSGMLLPEVQNPGEFE